MKLRHRFQIGSFIAISLAPLLEAKWLCLPILNCHSCPIAVFSCPIGILGHYLSLGMIPVFLLGTLLFFGALAGRAFCGWVCPFGFLQELLHKIPSPKFAFKPFLRYGRYAVLVITVLLVPFFLGLESPFYFCRLCPAAALEVSIPVAIQQGTFPSSWATLIKLSILVVVLLLSVVSLRFFCRALCPVGAITSLLNPISAFALRHNTGACPQCGQCAKACPVDVDLQEPKDAEPRGFAYKAPLDCILCLECTDVCPKSDGLLGAFMGMVRKGKTLTVKDS